MIHFNFSQPAFICSKLAIETLAQDVKYIQSYQTTHIEHIAYFVLLLLLLTLGR